jgi:MinD-like ATPase involved in chromosome partitioning or flagellar assembly
MTASRPAALKRLTRDTGPLIDGRRAPNGVLARLRRRAARATVSSEEREEAQLERQLRNLTGVTRPNVVASISPKGDVGKTSTTFLLATLLATHLKLRAIAVDVNPEFGTLAHLAPRDTWPECSLADLLRDADQVRTAAELRRYVALLPSGLHLLAAPRDPQLAPDLGPDRYGELVAFLSCFYDVVLLDLAPGIVAPLARFAVERADQIVIVTTPEWVNSRVVLEALSHLHHEHMTIAINKSYLRPRDADAVEDRFRAERLSQAVTIPSDDQLASMLDSGAYALEALDASTRRAIKRLGLAVAGQLV